MASAANSPFVPSISTLPPVSFIEQLSNECLLLIVEEVAHIKVGWCDKKPLKSLSLVSKRLRQLCIPSLFRFRMLKVQRRQHTIIPYLKALANAPFISSKLISLQLWIYNSDQEPIANQESISNQADIGHAVVAALSEMPSLQALSLRLGNNDSLTSKIRTAFRTSKTILAPIKALEVMEVPNAAFLLRACPSLDTFITNFPNKQHKKTFKALAGMSNVRRVQVENRKGWKTGHFQDLFQYIHTIPELCLRGGIYKSKPTDVALQFHNMPNLTSLAISSVPWVNYAYLSRHYFDRYLEAIEDRQDRSPYNEHPEIVAQAFFNASEKITTFRVLDSFSATKFRVVRKEDGSFDRISNQGNEGWEGFPVQWPRSVFSWLN